MNYLEYLYERRRAIQQKLKNNYSMPREMELLACLKEVNAMIQFLEFEPFEDI